MKRSRIHVSGRSGHRPHAASHKPLSGRDRASIVRIPESRIRDPLRRRSGFTLIEILVAIAILAVVLTTIYMSYISTMRVVKSLEQGDTVYNMARITLERMVLDLESACKVNDAFEFVAIRDDSAKLPLKGVSFLSRAHLDFSRAGQTMAVATIRYELEPDEQAGAFSIVRRDNLKSGGSSGGEGFALCRGLQSMNLRFFDRDGREYPFWDSRSGGGAQQNNIPAAITIELSFLNADDRSRPYKFMTKLLLTGARKT